MIQLNNGYKDYYYLDEDKVYNSKTEKYLKVDKQGCITLKREDNSSCHTSLNALLKLVHGATYAIDNIPSLPNEEWKVINPKYGYSVSNKGRIKSHVFRETMLLNPTPRNGYLRVRLNLGDGHKHYLVHKLVALKFLEPPKEAFMCIHHIDGCKDNNSADNLCFMREDEHRILHKELRNKNKTKE